MSKVCGVAKLKIAYPENKFEISALEIFLSASPRECLQILVNAGLHTLDKLKEKDEAAKPLSEVSMS